MIFSNLQYYRRGPKRVVVKILLDQDDRANNMCFCSIIWSRIDLINDPGVLYIEYCTLEKYFDYIIAGDGWSHIRICTQQWGSCTFECNLLAPSNVDKSEKRLGQPRKEISLRVCAHADGDRTIWTAHKDFKNYNNRHLTFAYYDDRLNKVSLVKTEH